MKWISREHVKVDRMACPWLIKKFVDKVSLCLVGRGLLDALRPGRPVPRRGGAGDAVSRRRDPHGPRGLWSAVVPAVHRLVVPEPDARLALVGEADPADALLAFEHADDRHGRCSPKLGFPLTRSAFPWFESYQAASASLYDQVWMTGWRFTSSMPGWRACRPRRGRARATCQDRVVHSRRVSPI